MKDARLKTRITERVVDMGSGEIVDEKAIQYLAENEKEFYITYCKVLGLFKDMRLGEIKTLAWLVSNSHFNNNMVVVTSGVKKKISEDMGISVGAVNNALTPLVKNGILYRDADSSERRDGVYYISPEYYWKGDLRERKRALRIVLGVKGEE